MRFEVVIERFVQSVIHMVPSLQGRDSGLGVYYPSQRKTTGGPPIVT
jgi:hypothetical protein